MQSKDADRQILELPRNITLAVMMEVINEGAAKQRLQCRERAHSQGRSLTVVWMQRDGEERIVAAFARAESAKATGATTNRIRKVMQAMTPHDQRRTQERLREQVQIQVSIGEGATRAAPQREAMGWR